MTESKALQLNPLTLAFVGDGVYTLFVRSYAVGHFDLKANKMDAFCRRYVRAAAQAAAYRELEESMTETEKGIALRARNSHPQNRAKNASLADYMHATALEAVIGFLYVTNANARLEELMTAAMEITDIKSDKKSDKTTETREADDEQG